jgi:hypothetical protein
MTSEQFDHVLIGLHQRRPFHPFTVELVSGHQFEVDHPHAMVIRDGVAVYLKPGGVPVWFDHDSVTQIVDDIANRSA